MRKLLHTIIDKLVALLYGKSTGAKAVYHTTKLSRLVEAKLFTEGQLLHHLEITVMDDGGYYLEMFTVEEMKDEFCDLS